MNWKETYTKVFLKQAGKSITELAVKEHLPLWWKNTRDKGASGLYSFLLNAEDIEAILSTPEAITIKVTAKICGSPQTI